MVYRISLGRANTSVSERPSQVIGVTTEEEFSKSHDNFSKRAQSESVRNLTVVNKSTFYN